MPRYAYKTESGEEVVIRHSVDELPLEEHPETGEELKRIFNADNILLKFKGTGFHSTDYNENDEPYDDDIMKNKSDPDKDTYSYK